MKEQLSTVFALPTEPIEVGFFSDTSPHMVRMRLILTIEACTLRWSYPPVRVTS